MRHWIANRGWRGFLEEMWRRIRVWTRGERPAQDGSDHGVGVARHPFDVRYGVETGGLIWGEALAGAGARKEAAGVAGVVALARDARLRDEEAVAKMRYPDGVDDLGAVAKIGHPGYVVDKVAITDMGYQARRGGAPAGGGEDSAYWVTGYYAVAPSAFSAAMERLALAWEQTTFVDVGCGKGRALLLALRYPFRRVVGVELSPELARVARENVRGFRAAWRQPEVPAEVVTGDACAMELPPGALLLFLYHPFAAPVMTRFLARVREAVRADWREVVLLYMNPELDGLLGRTASLERMWDECFAMSEEDRAADRFESAWERMVAYRVVPER